MDKDIQEKQEKLNTRSILLIGGGGHCMSVADSLLRSEQENKVYERIGIVDLKPAAPLFGCIPFAGTDDDLPKLLSSGWTDAFVTLGSIGNTSHREKLYSLIQSIGFRIPNISDPSAVISPYAELAQGIYIGKTAVVNAGCKIDSAAIINTRAVLEHNVMVGRYCHVSPGAIICGDTVIGDSSHIGAGSTVIQGIHIGSNVIVGAGAVVIHDVDSNKKIVGVPGREV